MENSEKKIILIGMTGVGKTTIGKTLSKEIKMNFCDIDFEIEKATNLKIKDFFKMYGEKEFRRIEKITLLKFINSKENYVISPGAGILNDKDNKKIICNSCISIFLDIKISSLISRLKKNLSNRPKLSQGKLEENLKQMYNKRINDYRACQITINVNETSVTNIVSQIILKIKNYDKNSQL